MATHRPDGLARAAGERDLGVTRNHLLGGRVRLLQPEKGYRVAIDPVLLAAAVDASPGQTVLDVGCGTGAAALCLATRLRGISVVGIDVQDELVELARANAEANGLADRVTFLGGDIHDPPIELAPNSFDQVMTNPPFGVPGRERIPPDASKARASVEDAMGLEGWLRFCLRILRPKGRVTLVHRADRLDEILAALRREAGEIVVFPLWPGPPTAPAKRVIIRARKAVRGPLRIAPGLVLHGSKGAYTPEAEAVLRHGEALNLP